MSSFQVGNSRVAGQGGGSIISVGSGQRPVKEVADALGVKPDAIKKYDTDNIQGFSEKELAILQEVLGKENGGNKKGGMNPLQNIPIIGQLFGGGGEGGGGGLLGGLLG